MFEPVTSQQESGGHFEENLQRIRDAEVGLNVLGALSRRGVVVEYTHLSLERPWFKFPLAIESCSICIKFVHSF